MSAMTGYAIALTACRPDEAESLARKLVESRLCACVNVVRGVRSTFWWKGDIQTDEECILIMKTSRDVADDLWKAVKKIHSYEVPEFVLVPVELGSSEYLRWISENVRTDGSGSAPEN